MGKVCMPEMGAWKLLLRSVDRQAWKRIDMSLLCFVIVIVLLGCVLKNCSLTVSSSFL